MRIEERYAQWSGIIDAQKTSGMTIAEYCRNQHIRSNVFYAWRRRVEKRSMDKQGFIELRSSFSNAATGISIVAGHFIIEVHRGFDPVTLRALLACIESR